MKRTRFCLTDRSSFTSSLFKPHIGKSHHNHRLLNKRTNRRELSVVFPYSLDSVHFDIDFLEKKQKQTNNYGKNLHYQIYDKLHFDSLHVQESILCNSSLSQRNNNKEPLNRKMEVYFSNEDITSI